MLSNKTIKRFFITLSTVFLVLAVFGVVRAACPSSANQADGINTHSSSDLAGLIVHVKNNDVAINDIITVGQDSSYTGSYINKVNSSYAVSDRYQSHNFTAGGDFYIAQQTTACSLDGIVFMGYGSSNSYGNKYGLDCKSDGGTTIQFTAKVNHTTSSTGWWKYYLDPSGADFVTTSRAYTARPADSTLSGTANDDPVVKFTVTNGYTARVVFNFQPVPQYDLIYNANGGTGAPALQTVYSGSQATVSTTIPTRAGYTFAGWDAASDGSGTDYVAGNIITLTADKTIFAKWTANPPTYPTCDILTVSPSTITQGGSATLTWSTTNSTSRTASWGTGVAASGTATVTPNTTTTYSLSATNASGTANCSGATVTVLTPTLSCPVTPPSGETPLVVKVVTTLSGGATGTIDYDMGDGTILTNKPTTFWYTYSRAGTYQIKAQTNDQTTIRKVTWQNCGAVNPNDPSVTTVTVTDPTDTTGGEIRP